MWCTSCAPGKYQDTDSMTFCSRCPTGRSSSTAGSVSIVNCTKCEPGQFMANTQIVCSECAAGKWGSEAGGQTSSLGACTQSCAVGKSGHGRTGVESEAAACIDCTAGKSQIATAQALCIDCTPGQHQGSMGQADCTNCPRGRFETNHASVKCPGCPAGYTTTTTGNLNAGRCSKCPIGKHATFNSSDVENEGLPAARKTWQTFIQCVTCPGGKYQEESGRTSCVGCATGFETRAKTQRVTAEDCVPCHPGRFATATNEGTLAEKVTGRHFRTCVW